MPRNPQFSIIYMGPERMLLCGVAVPAIDNPVRFRHRYRYMDAIASAGLMLFIYFMIYWITKDI